MQFHFFNSRTSLRYHLSNRLLALGWERGSQAESAAFSDKHLTLNDEVSKHFEYKHLLAQLLAKTCPAVLPITYAINDENYQSVIAKMIYDHYLSGDSSMKWILKPATLNNGDWIRLFNHPQEIKQYYAKPNRLGGEHIVQQYIANPDLIEGKKYTFRVWAVLTNYAGVFLCKQGYINISAFPFDLSDFSNRKIHITNYVLDGELSHITQMSTQDLPHFNETYEKMCQVVRCAVKALIKNFPGYLKPQKTKIFETFGFDFMLDAQGKLWLIEINQSPDAPQFEENKLTQILWDPFWQNMIDDFVLPIGLDASPKHHYDFFTQILTPRESYSAWRHVLNRKN